MLLHAAVWNALHPNMHSLPDIGIDEGVPSKWLAWARSTKFFKFLYVNHEGHHVVGGKGNYNLHMCNRGCKKARCILLIPRCLACSKLHFMVCKLHMGYARA